MSICPSCGGYLPRNSEQGICKECQLRREIESLRWKIGEIYRMLPLHVRAGLRGQRPGVHSSNQSCCIRLSKLKTFKASLS